MTAANREIIGGIKANDYRKVHNWLRSHYGPATHCENSKCPGDSYRFHWAKMKGKPYAKDRANFMQLCHDCHEKYDTVPKAVKLVRLLVWIPDTKKAAIKNAAKDLGITESAFIRDIIEEHV